MRWRADEEKIDFPFDNQTRYTCSIMRLNIIYTWSRYFVAYLLLVFLSPVVSAIQETGEHQETHINRSWWGNINLITFLRPRKLIICSARLCRFFISWRRWWWYGWDDAVGHDDEHFPQFNFMSFQSTCHGYRDEKTSTRGLVYRDGVQSFKFRGPISSIPRDLVNLSVAQIQPQFVHAISLAWPGWAHRSLADCLQPKNIPIA